MTVLQTFTPLSLTVSIISQYRFYPRRYVTWFNHTYYDLHLDQPLSICRKGKDATTNHSFSLFPSARIRICIDPQNDHSLLSFRSSLSTNANPLSSTRFSQRIDRCVDWQFIVLRLHFLSRDSFCAIFFQKPSYPKPQPHNRHQKHKHANHNPHDRSMR